MSVKLVTVAAHAVATWSAAPHSHRGVLHWLPPGVEAFAESCTWSPVKTSWMHACGRLLIDQARLDYQTYVDQYNGIGLGGQSRHHFASEHRFADRKP